MIYKGYTTLNNHNSSMILRLIPELYQLKFDFNMLLPLKYNVLRLFGIKLSFQDIQCDS
jgi:hypothetical protein